MGEFEGRCFLIFYSMHLWGLHFMAVLGAMQIAWSWKFSSTAIKCVQFHLLTGRLTASGEQIGYC